MYVYVCACVYVCMDVRVCMFYCFKFLQQQGMHTIVNANTRVYPTINKHINYATKTLTWINLLQVQQQAN